jgi:hypothetical protein
MLQCKVLVPLFEEVVSRLVVPERVLSSCLHIIAEPLLSWCIVHALMFAPSRQDDAHVLSCVAGGKVRLAHGHPCTACLKPHSSMSFLQRRRRTCLELCSAVDEGGWKEGRTWGSV